MESFFAKSKFLVFGQKPWTIIRRFGRNRAHCLWSFYYKVEGVMKLKFAPFCSSCDALSDGTSIISSAYNTSLLVKRLVFY